MKNIVAVFCFVSSAAFAAGFRLDSNAGRATGMASAVTALIDDSSANFYNPAGLTAQGKGFEVMAGATLIIPQVRFTPAGGGDAASTEFSISPPPHLFLRWGIIDELALGLGFYVPYGATSKWPEDWVGQFRARESSLSAYNLNLNLAFAPDKRISFAVGLDIIRGTLFIERHLDFGDGKIGEVQLAGGTWNVGANGGMRLELIEKTAWFGVSVRTPIALTVNGKSHFENIPVEFQSRIYDQDMRVSVTLPMTTQFGLGFNILDRARIGIDCTYVTWSSMQELKFEFLKNPDLTVPLQKRWHDNASFHVGGELDVLSSVQARLGFMYDPTPSPTDTLTPDLPDTTRYKFTAGVGWAHASGFFADLGYQFVLLSAANSTAPGLPGTYSGSAQVVSLSIGFRMPSGRRGAK